MNIDIKRWFSIFSACSLGWLCGFTIYSFIVFKLPTEGTLVHPQSQVQALPVQRDNGSLYRAVLRITKSQRIPPKAGFPHLLPNDSNNVKHTPRSYFL